MPKISLITQPEMRPFWAFVFISLVAMAFGFAYASLIPALIITVVSIGMAYLFFYFGTNGVKRSQRTKRAFFQFERIINSLPDGVIAYDTEFTVNVFNPAAERIFGINKSEIIGQKLGPDKIQNEKLKPLIQTIFPSLASLVVPKSAPGEVPQVVDITFTEPALELRVATAPMSADDSHGFIKVVTDRTREAEIYRSKSEFITIAAHQLQTPLTATYWALDVLRKDETLTGEAKSIANDGFSASQNLTKIVNDLLDVAKIEEGKFGYDFQQTDIIAFMGEVLKNANMVAKSAGVNMYFDPGPEPQIILNFDPAKLAVALSNLLDNAIKYNLKNGSVTVKVERVPQKPFIQISVTDTGVGIPSDSLQRVFKKFYRAENAIKVQTEGTGLGLYITKNIIRRHGGTIGVNSTVDRGSVFYFTLPTDPRLIPHKEVPYEE